MAEPVENTITVIKQTDPDLPRFMDFDRLRKEGLEHIGRLSGKIWTDHNLHDPGITILEVLIYALMDLGYRTNFPFRNLVAPGDQQDTDDNFLTPLQILTINPVTITDYRKLLLEIEGVRNAWLEPAVEERELYIDSRRKTLRCTPESDSIPVYCEDKPVFSDRENDKKRLFGQLHLNGLYKVFIEKENDVEDEEKLKGEVKKILSGYRNLCEDVAEICVLKPVEFEVCIEAELRPGYPAEEIYRKIILTVKNFIQPQINYYTLRELLDQGKEIEDIFAGRPYRPQSVGFVDTEELESLEKREFLHLSDLYNVVLSVEGVKKIRKIHLHGGDNKKDSIACEGELRWNGNENWKGSNKLKDDEVPVFSLDKTCVDLYSAEGLLRIDKTRIHKSFSFAKKFDLPPKDLDTQIPYGRRPEDMEDYYSIQNDFPVVYGIGEDGLSDRATLLRKTQALQLKGYLMFYDQLLADYTAQLAHIRSLFSLKPESKRGEDEKRTCFTQLPETIPGLEKLLKFYGPEQKWTRGTSLAVPVSDGQQWKKAVAELDKNSRLELTVGNFCDGKNGLVDLYTFESFNIRKVYVNLLTDTFSDGNYEIGVLRDRYGYFFVLHPNLPDDILLVGTRRYPDANKARNEAKNTAFLASMEKSYHLTTDPSGDLSPDKHYFSINYQPVSYLEIIQEITENKQEYIGRRRQFLDHLLARFGEDFTDYTLLLYQREFDKKERERRIIDDQSAYLSEIAEISRNRGKAFDYLEPSWNTDNVSGFEKRVSLLAGIEDHTRRNLCNFEVSPCYKLQLHDWRGQVLFRSNRSYETREELSEAAIKVLERLRDPGWYLQLEKSLNGFNAVNINRIFSERPNEENIVVTKYNYHQELLNAEGKIAVGSSNRRMSSFKAAAEKKRDFISSVNKQRIIIPKPGKKSYRLIPLEIKDRFLDVNALNSEMITLVSWKWHVLDADTGEKTVSSPVFEEREEAWDHILANAPVSSYLAEHETALHWKLNVNKYLTFRAMSFYPDAYKAVAAWRQAKTLGSDTRNCTVEEQENTFTVSLKDEKGNTIAISDPVYIPDCDTKTAITDAVQVFRNRNTKPVYDKVKEKFGFKIPVNELLSLAGYCAYDTPVTALKKIGEVYELGRLKKNYLMSGDEGNPEYNFILRSADGSFLAQPPDHFETASDRNRALNTMLRFFKENELPVSVEEEPRRYVWSLFDEGQEIMSSHTEFPSKARARADFDHVMAGEALKPGQKLFKPYIYEFQVQSTPALYKFLYGVSDSQQAFEPLFLSSDTFKKPEEVSEAYTDFVRKLPGLSLRSPKEKKFNFALYASADEETPVAVQYTKRGYKASLQTARAITAYVSSIYTEEGQPKEAFVEGTIVESQQEQYEWRFYKKNAPLARSPYCCPEEEQARRIKAAICDIIPPVDLRECPPKEVVVCPEKDPKKFHYRVCFKDRDKHKFELISYCGFDSYEEAAKAWKKEWLEVLELARDPEQYMDGGKISMDETYKKVKPGSCDETSFMAVIPGRKKQQIEENGEDVIEYYTKLAALFPVYKVEEEGEVKYKYRVVVPQEGVIEADCEFTGTPLPGSLIWESTNCYKNEEDAIRAYRRFYVLAGIHNNCRILCERGCYYVGVIEVLAESFCEYGSEAEAWDDAFPDKTGACGDCVPGGVREFIYAAEDDKNYIPICEDKYWKFKVVSPDYFVADHRCIYNSETERDTYIQHWASRLKQIDWDAYNIPSRNTDEFGISFQPEISGELSRLKLRQYDTSDICDRVQAIRESLEECPESEKGSLRRLTDYFPVYRTENGYCFRLYWPENDKVISEEGLQPCGCDCDETEETRNPCEEPYPFVSSRCYSCCAEALEAFAGFRNMIRNGTYVIEAASAGKCGPYSFYIADKRRELAYHPQQYDSLQEVKDAIQLTRSCVENTGMHLLEHILLRPQKEEGQSDIPRIGYCRCLLPICPDYCCPITWQPDIEDEDPCAEPGSGFIHYIPGSDPYSFWATLVMPSWSKQFRTEEARSAFEKLLYREVPALVGLHILWLSPKDMCKFEEAYRRWLEWMQEPEARLCDTNGTHPHCQLTTCIRDLKSEEACPSIPGAQGDCKCEGGATPSEDECCLPSDTRGTIFWNCCPDVISARGDMAVKPAKKTTKNK